MISDNELQYICDNHLVEKDYKIISPCRAKCAECKEKKVHGYENPDHVCNPFGYLFLFPNLCDKCSEKLKVCKWCILDDS